MKVISGTINDFIVCISKNTAHNVQSMRMVGRHVSHYFYCSENSTEGLLYDAERDLLAIAKFLVTVSVSVLL